MGHRRHKCPPLKEQSGPICTDANLWVLFEIYILYPNTYNHNPMAYCILPPGLDNLGLTACNLGIVLGNYTTIDEQEIQEGRKRTFVQNCGLDV